MNLIELQRALRQLRLGGTAAVLETRLRQAQTEAMAPIDLVSCLVSDELTRRSERLLDRRRKQAAFQDPSALHTSLALRQAIWRKEDAGSCAASPIFRFLLR